MLFGNWRNCADALERLKLEDGPETENVITFPCLSFNLFAPQSSLKDNIIRMGRVQGWRVVRQIVNCHNRIITIIKSPISGGAPHKAWHVLVDVDITIML